MISSVLFILLVFAAYTVQAITGFGGPLLAMPFGIQLIGLSGAKGILTVLAWLTAIAVAVPNRKYINWKELVKIVLVMLVGLCIGLWLYDLVPKELLLLIYGVIVVLIALKNLLIKKEFHAPAWLMLIVLLLAGITQGLFVSGGAFLIIYAMYTFKDKNEFRATSCAVWSVMNLFLVLANLRAGLVTLSTLPLMGISIAVGFVAVWLGGALQKKLDRNKFLLLTNALLLVSGVSLLLNR